MIACYESPGKHYCCPSSMTDLIGIVYNGHVMRVVFLRLGMFGDSDQPEDSLTLSLKPSSKARHVSEDVRGLEALYRQFTSLWFLCFLSFLFPIFIFWLAPHDPSILDHAWEFEYTYVSLSYRVS